MTRPVDPKLEFRRARAVELLNARSIFISLPESAALGGHEPARDTAKHRGTVRPVGVIGTVAEHIRDICERLLWAALKRIQRSNYFDCHVSQDGSEVVCIDGDGFRVVSGRHRLFLHVGGKQHNFVIVDQWTDEEIAALRRRGHPVVRNSGRVA